MIRHSAALALAMMAMLSTPVSARIALDADDAVPAALVAEVAACMAATGTGAEGAALSCLEREGVPPGARDFASALLDGTALGVPGILLEVIETGPVDAARVILPTLSTEDAHWVLVNGRHAAALAPELAFSEVPPDTPGTRRLSAAHPGARETSRVAVVAHRILPEGAQRFVLADPVTEACRGCPTIGVALTYLDFVGGVLVNVERLGWFPAPPEPQEIAEGLEAADIALLQSRLNLHGYDAGPVDGVAGRRTLGAFYQLKRDHCLPEDPRIRPVIPILAAELRDLAPAPCAPAVFQRPAAATAEPASVP